MLAAIGMVGLLLSERAMSWRASARLAALSLGVGYAATVIANTIRIVVALWLARHALGSDFWTAARVHRTEGIVVYFGMLVALHVVVQRAASTCERLMEAFHWAGLPLASYYLVTIAIPLANGLGDTSRGFLEHMVFVVLVFPMLVGFLALLRHS